MARFRSGVKLRYGPSFFQLQYFAIGEDPFSFLDVAGKCVLDVGASIGDSSIYFSMKGAKRVIALEPFPFAYNEALENLKLKAVDNVIMLNRGLSSYNHKIMIPAQYVGGLDNFATDRGSGIAVEMTTLSTLVNEFGLEDAILKMNCEGCEYDSLLAADDKTIDAFSDIVLFYHRGSRSLFINAMTKRGFAFKVMHNDPIQGTLYFSRVKRT
ncbi:MAG: FkbM family methyltransferase [Conexivisphaerales archaeon]